MTSTPCKLDLEQIIRAQYSSEVLITNKNNRKETHHIHHPPVHIQGQLLHDESHQFYHTCTHFKHLDSQVFLNPLLGAGGILFKAFTVLLTTTSSFSPMRVCRQRFLSLTLSLIWTSIPNRWSSWTETSVVWTHTASLSTYSTLLCPDGPQEFTTSSAATRASAGPSQKEDLGMATNTSTGKGGCLLSRCTLVLL